MVRFAPFVPAAIVFFCSGCQSGGQRNAGEMVPLPVAGPPVAKVLGGETWTFDRMLPPECVTAIRVIPSPLLAEHRDIVTNEGVRDILLRARPMKADDPNIEAWHYLGMADVVVLTTRAGEYQLELFGGRVVLVAPDGRRGYFEVLPASAVQREPPLPVAGPPFSGHWGRATCTFDRLPSSEAVSTIRVTNYANPSWARDNGAPWITDNHIRTILATARALRADDPTIDNWHYASWCAAELETRAGWYQLQVYFGGRVELLAPDGKRGYFQFRQADLTGLNRPAGGASENPASGAATSRAAPPAPTSH